MSHLKRTLVYGHHLPPPRLTAWVPLLVASALSLPVLVITLIAKVIA